VRSIDAGNVGDIFVHLAIVFDIDDSGGKGREYFFFNGNDLICFDSGDFNFNSISKMPKEFIFSPEEATQF
jgi:hypothetical protein